MGVSLRPVSSVRRIEIGSTLCDDKFELLKTV